MYHMNRVALPVRSSIITVLLVALIVVSTCVSATDQSIEINIDSSGVPHVKLHVFLEQGLNTLKLPVEPIDNTIIILCGGAEPAWVFSDGLLSIYSDVPCGGVIEYIANVTIDGGALTLRIDDSATVALSIDSDVVMLSLPEDVDSLAQEEGRIVMTLRGPATLVYTLASTATPSTSLPESSPQTPVPAEPEERGLSPVYIALIVMVLVIALVTTLVLTRKR
uniref:Uncharacterized protein n=1 Tax=Ignisphaera aggregans TaxID=334771 RepID=A0A7C2VDQ5_9CREN